MIPEPAADYPQHVAFDLPGDRPEEVAVDQRGAIAFPGGVGRQVGAAQSLEPGPVMVEQRVFVRGAVLRGKKEKLDLNPK